MNLFTSHVAPKRGTPENLWNAKPLKTTEVLANQLPVICLRCFWLFWSLRASHSPIFPSKRPGFFFCHYSPGYSEPFPPQYLKTQQHRSEMKSTRTWRCTKIHRGPVVARTASQPWLAPAPPCAEPPQPLRPPAPEDSKRMSEGHTNQIQPVHSDMNLPPKCIQV